MEFSKKFSVGDMVVAYRQYVGWIAYVNYKNQEADVEFDYGNTDYDAAVVPFKHLEKVEKVKKVEN